ALHASGANPQFDVQADSFQRQVENPAPVAPGATIAGLAIIGTAEGNVQATGSDIPMTNLQLTGVLLGSPNNTEFQTAGSDVPMANGDPQVTQPQPAPLSAGHSPATAPPAPPPNAPQPPHSPAPNLPAGPGPPPDPHGPPPLSAGHSPANALQTGSTSAVAQLDMPPDHPPNTSPTPQSQSSSVQPLTTTTLPIPANSSQTDSTSAIAVHPSAGGS